VFLSGHEELKVDPDANISPSEVQPSHEQERYQPQFARNLHLYEYTNRRALKLQSKSIERIMMPDGYGKHWSFIDMEFRGFYVIQA
jgi:hypothetical protein